MKDELISGSVGTFFGIVGTATQVNDVLRTISLILTIIGAILTYIVMPSIAWYKRAKQDGKIDADEIKEGVEIISNGSNDVKDVIDDLNEKKEGK